MQKLRGWKTIIIALVAFVLGGVNRMTEFVELPPWVFEQILPALMLIMRFLTSTPAMKADAQPKQQLKSNR